MNLKQRVEKDPRFAAARPWNWQVCTQCEDLVPVTEDKCPRCGEGKFDTSPGAVIQIGIRRHGIPPSRFSFQPDAEN